MFNLSLLVEKRKCLVDALTKCKWFSNIFPSPLQNEEMELTLIKKKPLKLKLDICRESISILVIT